MVNCIADGKISNILSNYINRAFTCISLSAIYFLSNYTTCIPHNTQLHMSYIVKSAPQCLTSTQSETKNQSTYINGAFNQYQRKSLCSLLIEFEA